MIPYKRDFVTLNKSVINYLPRCSYHLLYMGAWCGDVVGWFMNHPTTMHPCTTHAPTHAMTHAQPSLSVNQIPIPFAPNTYVLGLHDTSALSFTCAISQVTLPIIFFYFFYIQTLPIICDLTS